MTYLKIIETVAKELNLPIEFVDKTYLAYWQVLHDKVQSLPLKDELSDEEFMNLKTVYNIPSIGKLYCTLEYYKGLKAQTLYINGIKKRHKTNK